MERFAILLGAALIPTFTEAALADVLRVDPQNGPYTTIQSAIDAAVNGDTIELVPFVYDELVAVVDKDLTIRSVEGRETTIWDGANTHRLLVMADAEVSIQSLTFQNGMATAGGGGAVRARRSRLVVDDCQFLRNECALTSNRSQGGAIYVSDASSEIQIRKSLFAENRTRGIFNNGGAIAFTIFDTGSPSQDDSIRGGAPMILEDCAFLRNISGWDGAAVMNWVSDVYATRCLFAENRVLGGLDFGELFAMFGDEVHLSCALIWNDDAPEVWDEELGPARRGIDYIVADPRVCPTAPLTLHESSPAFSTTSCETIGGLSVGCTGPMVLSLRTTPINPEGEQTIRIYGYGLDGADSAVLVSPNGRIRVSRDVRHDDAWLAMTFDLTGAEPGPWQLVLKERRRELIRIPDAVQVLPFAVFAFRDAWIEGRGQRDLLLAQHGWTDHHRLSLFHAETGEQLEVMESALVATDTLRVTVGLDAAAEGLYHLVVTSGQHLIRVPHALRLGLPPVLNVPEDYASLGAALSAAPPGAEIAVAPGIYRESIVIDRPVRLSGTGDVRIRPPNNGLRGIRVLESAGRITTIQGVRIEQCRDVSGSGAGVWSEAPLVLRDCTVYANSILSEGNGGGAWLAPGSQVIGSEFISNLIPDNDDIEIPDPFQAEAGVGGGLYCLTCRVDRNEFSINHAPSVGAACVTGLFRENDLGQNRSYSWRAGIDEFAAQGVITGNLCDNICDVANPPRVYIVGPSTVSYNTFSDVWRSECSDLSLIQLQGPVEFYQNTLVGAGLQVCLHCQIPPSPAERVSIRNNLFQLDEAPSPNIGYCESRLVPGPVFSVPEIDRECNLGDPVAIYGPDGRIPCEDCVTPVEDLGFCKLADPENGDFEFDLRLREDSPALPENSPIGCTDTLGAQPVGCSASLLDVAGALSLPVRALLFEPIQPHPSTGLDQLAFVVPSDGTARIDLIDVTGRAIRILWQGPVMAGRNTVRSDPSRSLESGVYWVRLTSGEHVATQRLIVVQ